MALLGVALLFAVDSANATPGGLDPGFGSGGIATTTIGSGGSQANALAVQPDGKIVAGGQTLVGSEDEFALARYNPDGTLDTSFGSGGKVTTAIGSVYDDIHALVLQPDGKILVAGGSYGSESEFALARYNPDGSPDTSFGSGGEVVTPIDAIAGGYANAVALQPDGKIVVGGPSGNNDFVIARYNPNGSPDTSFGTEGIVMTATGELAALALQPDGKIVAAGTDYGEMALARYNPDGSPDTSFGTGGTTVTNFYDAAANGLVLQPDGKLVVGGMIDSDLGLVRFNADGTLDTSFGETGGGSDEIRIGSISSGQALVQQSDGELVLAGYATIGSTHEFALIRFHADGSTDAGFGTNSEVTTPIGATGSVADAVAVEPDGKIVAGGYTETGSNDTTGNKFALARYLVTSTLTASTSGNGSGVVTSSPAGIDCGTVCSETFAQPTSVVLTATPAADSIFTGWTGGGTCSGTTGSCGVYVGSDQSLTASFALAEALTISKTAGGSGKVTSHPAGIRCGPTCSHAYAYGTTVTLTASPAAGSAFRGWSGACTGTGTCSLTMKQAKVTKAIFERKPACIVPELKGNPLAAARHRIERAHCRIGKISRRYSTSGTGRVIGQRPHPKTHLRDGAEVNLVVSKGRRP